MTFRFVFLAAVAVGSVASAKPKSSGADLMASLPATSRHVFRPALSAWTKKVEYLHLQDNKAAFIVLPSSQKPDLRTDWRDVTYFENARETDRNNFRKALRFRPNGSLASEIDRTGDEQFDRDFRRDGAVVSYEHLVDKHRLGWKRIAGFSVSPNGMVTRFSGGHGDWIEWADGSNFTHNWVHNGDFYLIKRVESEHLIQTSLLVSGVGELQLSPTGEELNLFSLHERWHKEAEQPVRASISDYHINGENATIVKDVFPDDGIKRHIRAMQPKYQLFRARSGPPRKPDPLLQKQLEADYLQRRAGFLSNFATTLKSAGQSFESLGLKPISAAKS